MLIAVGVGLTIINTRAVLEALFGIESGLCGRPSSPSASGRSAWNTRSTAAAAAGFPTRDSGGHVLCGNERVRDPTYNFFAIPFLLLFVVGYYWAASALYTRSTRAGCAGSNSGTWRWPGRRRSQNPSIPHVHDVVPVGRGFGVVRDHEDGLAQPLVSGRAELPAPPSSLHYRDCRWARRQQNGGVVHNRARDRHALLLAPDNSLGLCPAGFDAEQSSTSSNDASGFESEPPI